MSIFRRITTILGCICIFGAAGTDQMYVEWGQMPPESVGRAFVVGLVLWIPSLVHFILERGHKHG